MGQTRELTIRTCCPNGRRRASASAKIPLAWCSMPWVFLGVPYRRAGESKETGFDCSGFVCAVFEQSVGLLLPRNASQQAASTEHIDTTELRPGDLVFFNTMRRAFIHVGIHIGDDKFIHAPRSGAKVRLESLKTSYWRRRFDAARRVENGSSDTAHTPAALQSSLLAQ